jgi:hypothetical protein
LSRREQIQAKDSLVHIVVRGRFTLIFSKSRRKESCANATRGRLTRQRGSILALLVTIATLAGVAQNSAPVGQDKSTPDQSIHDPTPIAPPEANARQAPQQSYAASATERKKQIAADSAQLLRLANDLKSEVDKTNKDTLSLNVIRKADEIEKLAHSVRERTKLAGVPSLGGMN